VRREGLSTFLLTVVVDGENDAGHEEDDQRRRKRVFERHHHFFVQNLKARLFFLSSLVLSRINNKKVIAQSVLERGTLTLVTGQK
jgi:hypothetical protein